MPPSRELQSEQRKFAPGYSKWDEKPVICVAMETQKLVSPILPAIVSCSVPALERWLHG